VYKGERRLLYQKLNGRESSCDRHNPARKTKSGGYVIAARVLALTFCCGCDHEANVNPYLEAQGLGEDDQSVAYLHSHRRFTGTLTPTGSIFPLFFRQRAPYTQFLQYVRSLLGKVSPET